MLSLHTFSTLYSLL